MLYKYITLGLSGKTDEAPVIKEACRIAFECGAEITAVHVNDPDAGKTTMMIPGTGHKYTVEDIMNLIIEYSENSVIKDKVKVKIVTDTNVANGILKAAPNTDILVLGHKKMSLVKEALTDSMDELIVNRITCPVLVVRQQ